MEANEVIDWAAGALDTPDMKLLQGLWVSVEGRRPVEFHIEGRRFHVRFRDGDLYAGWLDVVIDERPRTMIMNIIDGPAKHKGKTAVCIYEFDGETMRWCPAEPGDDDPPDDFPAIEDKRFLCTIFHRESPRMDDSDSASTHTPRSR